MEPRSTLFLVFGCSLYTHNLTLSKGGSNGREIRSQGCFPGFGAIVVCFPTVVFHRHLVVVVRAVWRCMVALLKGSVWVVGWEHGCGWDDVLLHEELHGPTAHVTMSAAILVLSGML